MEAVLIILGLAGLYFLLEKAHSSSALGMGADYRPPQESYSGPGQSTGLMIGSLADSAVAAIPVVGSALSAIGGGMLAASAKRRKQAINENMAVANFIP